MHVLPKIPAIGELPRWADYEQTQKLMWLRVRILAELQWHEPVCKIEPGTMYGGQ